MTLELSRFSPAAPPCCGSSSSSSMMTTSSAAPSWNAILFFSKWEPWFLRTRGVVISDDHSQKETKNNAYSGPTIVMMTTNAATTPMRMPWTYRKPHQLRSASAQDLLGCIYVQWRNLGRSSVHRSRAASSAGYLHQLGTPDDVSYTAAASWDVITTYWLRSGLTPRIPSTHHTKRAS
jgi:hypothetical protein